MKQAPYADQLQYSGDLFTCLIFFMSHSRIFHSYGDVTITGEAPQILTYT